MTQTLGKTRFDFVTFLPYLMKSTFVQTAASVEKGSLLPFAAVAHEITAKSEGGNADLHAAVFQFHGMGSPQMPTFGRSSS